MEHQITVQLTEDEYTLLKAKAEMNGQKLEALIHDLLLLGKMEMEARRIPLSQKPNLPDKPGRLLSNWEISELFYREGLTERIPSGKPLSAKEAAELKRLADLFGQAGGKPASEMVIEDRGPY